MPTFGDTTAGGDTFPCTNDRAVLSKFTCSTSGTLTQINVRFDSTSSAGASFKGLIYADDGAGNTPGTRLGVGGATAVGAGGGDLASTGLSVSVVGGTDYWIGGVVSDFQPTFQMESGGVGGSRMEATTYASPAASWTEAATTSSTMNAYGTYTEDAGGGLAWIRA